MIDESHRFVAGDAVVVCRWALRHTERLSCVVSRVRGDMVSVRHDGKPIGSFQGPKRRYVGTWYGPEPELLTPEEDSVKTESDRCFQILRALPDRIRNVPNAEVFKLLQLLEQCLELTNDHSPKGE